MAGERTRLQTLREIEAAEKRIADFRKANDMRFKKNQLEELKIEKEIIGLKKEAETLKKQGLKTLADTEKSISSISNSYRDFKSSQKEVLDISRSADALSDVELEKIDKILDTSRQISDLTVEDEAQLEALTSQYNDQFEELKKIDGITEEILAKVQKQNKEGTSLAKKTKEQKDTLDVSTRANEELKQKMQGFAENIQTAITYMTSLQGVIGLALLGLGDFLAKAHEINKTFGSVGSGISGVAGRATLLSYIFKDSAEAAGGLAANLGGVGQGNQLGGLLNTLETGTAAIAENMGISGAEAADLVTSFMMLNNGSEQTSLDLVKSSQEFAKQNGIIPAQLMSELAKSTEEFALFGEDGGENIIRAAGYAKKLGVEMKSLSGIADGLLDFETSITKELELSAMLGRNINLQKARQLAYDNDIEGATKEVLNQLGGISAFNKMDYYQKKQTADLLGVSVDEFKKMATNQEKANKLGEVGNETFSSMFEGAQALLGNFGSNLVSIGASLLLLRTLAGGAGAGIASLFGGVATGVASVGTAVTTTVASAGPALAGFFTSLATGLATLANPATLIGLAAVALGFMAIGFSLALAAPAIEAFGKVIGAVLGGVASIAGTVFGGLTDMLGVITLEKAASIYLLGAGFFTLAAGIGALGIAAFFGGGSVEKFLTKLGDLDTSKLQQNANAIRNFAQGLATLTTSIDNLDTEKLEKLERVADVSVSIGVGSAIANVGSAVGSFIDTAAEGLFGDGKSTQEKMLAELTLIRENLGAPTVIKMNGEKMGEAVATTNDGTARNASKLD